MCTPHFRVHKGQSVQLGLIESPVAKNNPTNFFTVVHTGGLTCCPLPVASGVPFTVCGFLWFATNLVVASLKVIFLPSFCLVLFLLPLNGMWLAREDHCVSPSYLCPSTCCLRRLPWADLPAGSVLGWEWSSSIAD